MFEIRRNPQTDICPIRAIEQYIDVARQMNVDLTRGYLFRPTTPNGGIQDVLFTSAAAEARLKTYLKAMGVDKGETLHGFRAGCAITLALNGADLSKIMEHVGWNRRHTAVVLVVFVALLHAVG